MGIDGIGSRGPVAPPPAAPATGSEGAARPGALFEVDKSAAPAATTAATSEVASVGSAPLERLRAGAIDVAGYVDAKVEEATAHLGALPPAQLDAIRSALRDRMASDPTLVDLVRAATGQVPAALGDDS